MTAERLGGQAPQPGPAARGSGPDALPLEAILSLCDRLLKEPGRRRHLFAWLRAPEAGPEEWLAVDAYYPARRVVVICEPQQRPHGHLYAELVPQHGLRLLEIATEELGGDLAAAEQTLQRRIATLAPVRKRLKSVAPPAPITRQSRPAETAPAKRIGTPPRPRRTLTERLAAVAPTPVGEVASPPPAGPRRQAAMRAARHV